CSLPLFLYSPRAPPTLPSFPTRRSSDLPCRSGGVLNTCARSTTACRAMANVSSACRAHQPSSPIITTALASRMVVSAASHDSLRSEEHTSELQSLRHLVCRLLLEKKKKR